MISSLNDGGISPKGKSLRNRGSGKVSHLATIDLEKDFFLHETVFGSGFPRLNKARDFLGELKQEDIPYLMDVFELWKNYDTYLFLKGTHRETAKTQYLLSKCSKRGNDVYARRIDARLGFLKYKDNRKFFDGLDFDDHGQPLDKKKGVKTRLLWVTLTFDSKLSILDDAWRGEIVTKVKQRGKNIGGEYLGHSLRCRCIQCQFNLWITNLRNEYGKINYVVFPQAYPDKNGDAFGYPHIHIILLFEEKEFNVFQTYKFDKRKKEWGFVYRIQEKKELHEQGKWLSFSDVKAIQSLSALYNYAKKHFFNAGYGDSDEATLNNSVMWFYKKKSFNMSGDFREKLSEFIRKDKHNSKRFQAVLDGGKPFSVIEWEFLGCFSAKRIKRVLDVGDPPFDFISLSVDEADKLLNPSVKERLRF